MNNYDRIRNMSIDEMAEWIKNLMCNDGCVIVPATTKCTACLNYLKQWLLAESEG